MKFYRKLYVGDSVKDPEKVKWKLIHNAGQFKVYVIALAQSADQLDIFHCALLKQRCYDKEHLSIVGIAGSNEEAVDLVIQMIQKTVDETGGADIKGYIRKMEQREEIWESF